MKKTVQYVALVLFFLICAPTLVYADPGAEKEVLELIEKYSLLQPNIELCKSTILEEFKEANESLQSTGEPIADWEKRLACLDEHSSFLSEIEMHRMAEVTEGNFGGIGVTVAENDGKVIVDGVVAGKPADTAGIKAGDIIQSVRQNESSPVLEIKNFSDALDILRGEAGSSILITVMRGEAQLTFSVTREKIKLSTVAFKKLSSGVGYVQVTGHNEETADDFEIALRAIGNGEDAPRVIIDMRDNPGGNLFSPIEMLFYFSEKPEDIIVTIRDRTAEDVITVGSMRDGFVYPKTQEKKKPGMFKDYVAIVLINEGTASAAEIFAGTMRDWGSAHGRFIILGAHSYGKGVGQTIYTLSGGMGLQLTTFEFLVGNEKKGIHKIGVIPTIEVKDLRGSPEETLTEKDIQFWLAEETLQYYVPPAETAK
ncbi:MAG: PDZ domain-containing protein [Parcubacteria group bacterium]|nr:PDZ domain-containing protein [Parcubacteria group bacterium]